MAWSHSCCFLTHSQEYTQNFHSKQKQLLCWGEKWHLCSVGNENLERNEPKGFTSSFSHSSVSLPEKRRLTNHIIHIYLAIRFSSSGMNFESYVTIEQGSKNHLLVS